MDTPHLLSALRTQGRLLAGTPVEALAERVPAVPGWTVEHVLRHTGKVHLWVAAALRAEPGTPLAEIHRDGDMPRGPECVAAYRAALDAVLAEFDRHGADHPVPTMVGPGTVGWWIRRQAHEVSIHRVDVSDAISAAGGPDVPALEAGAAADGVDEWAHVFLGRLASAGKLPESLDGRTIHLHGTDAAAAEWHLAFEPGAVVVTREHRKGDVALRGPAQDLLLAMWRRRPLAGLDTVGDHSVAQDLLNAVAL
ncbi:uncharacterized protein (TIGR03083 family) [Rhodococcus sp. OK519]|uniref:maleylpyruvate isomerase N-terminal domain-containing protein n=1 Tax=Rhodococcus sp. OK519 TaxID=2135729 RepID=UPI000D35B85C|nr:uncharacterized protein (TIGR03083 family) [Rhodococcus sp. OK519]